MAKKSRDYSKRLINFIHGRPVISFNGAFFSPVGGKTHIKTEELVDVAIPTIIVSHEGDAEHWKEVKMTFVNTEHLQPEVIPARRPGRPMGSKNVQTAAKRVTSRRKRVAK